MRPNSLSPSGICLLKPHKFQTCISPCLHFFFVTMTWSLYIYKSKGCVSRSLFTSHLKCRLMWVWSLITNPQIPSQSPWGPDLISRPILTKRKAKLMPTKFPTSLAPWLLVGIPPEATKTTNKSERQSCGVSFCFHVSFPEHMVFGHRVELFHWNWQQPHMQYCKYITVTEYQVQCFCAGKISGSVH